MRVGLVGCGIGGRHFHAPFMAATDGVELVGVVARAPATVAAVRADLPGVPIHPSLTAAIAASGLDAVTITTPPRTRRELVLEAIAAGLHVIADRPFAPSAAAGRELEKAARAKGVILCVFHNRRWDLDTRTLRKVVEGSRVGRLWLVPLADGPRRPRYAGGRAHGRPPARPGQQPRGPDAPAPVAGDAQLDMVDLPKRRTDAGFTITLRHASGAHSHRSASTLNHVAVREPRAYGEAGSYASSGTDVQAQSIFAGRRPVQDPAGWGFEPESSWGVLRTSASEERVPAEQGRYHDYYAAFAHAVRDGGAPPVTAAEAINALAVLDAARISAMEGRSIGL